MHYLFTCFAALLLAAPRSPAPPIARPAPLNVAFVVYPGVQTLDLSGPLKVFLKANLLTNNGYRCYTVALADSALRTDQGGLNLHPDYVFAAAPRPDILVVPGTSADRIQHAGVDQRLLAQLRTLAPHVPQVLAVCTGAWLLAQAGILDGHRATTHWALTAALAQQFPRVRVVRGVRYVADGPVLTTAGTTAGIDGALHVVAQYSGRDVAAATARALAYPWPAGAAARVGNRRVNRPLPTSTPQPAATFALIDPVCHMAIAPTTAHRAAYREQLHGFCSASCRRIFVAMPQRYVP